MKQRGMAVWPRVVQMRLKGRKKPESKEGCRSRALM
jgi:hypothetical protein